MTDTIDLAARVTLDTIRDRARGHWSYRMVENMRERWHELTKFDNVCLAVIGKSRPTRAFGNSAVIAPDGTVLAAFTDKDGKDQGVVPVYENVKELRDDVLRLIETLQSTDVEAAEIMRKFGDWIYKDFRPQDEIEKDVAKVRAFKH